MTEAEKRTPQEIAAAIKETVRTLNEHLDEAAEAGIVCGVESYAIVQINGVEKIKVAASTALKL